MAKAVGKAERSFRGDTSDWVQTIVYNATIEDLQAYVLGQAGQFNGVDDFKNFFWQEYDRDFRHTEEFCDLCGAEFSVGQEMYAVEGDVSQYCKKCAEEIESDTVTEESEKKWREEYRKQLREWNWEHIKEVAQKNTYMDLGGNILGSYLIGQINHVLPSGVNPSLFGRDERTAVQKRKDEIWYEVANEIANGHVMWVESGELHSANMVFVICSMEGEDNAIL